MARTARKDSTGKRLATQQSVDQAVKSICDIMRRGNCAGAMQYVPELTWILFLRILDEKEHAEEQEAEALGVAFRPSLDSPYRWRDWGAPPAEANHQDTKTQSVEKDSGGFVPWWYKIHRLETLRTAERREGYVSHRACASSAAREGTQCG